MYVLSERKQEVNADNIGTLIYLSLIHYFCLIEGTW